MKGFFYDNLLLIFKEMLKVKDFDVVSFKVVWKYEFRKESMFILCEKENNLKIMINVLFFVF